MNHLPVRHTMEKALPSVPHAVRPTSCSHHTAQRTVNRGNPPSVPSMQSPGTTSTRPQPMAPQLPNAVAQSHSHRHAVNSDAITETEHPSTAVPSTEAATPQRCSARAGSNSQVYIGFLLVRQFKVCGARLYCLLLRTFQTVGVVYLILLLSEE